MNFKRQTSKTAFLLKVVCKVPKKWVKKYFLLGLDQPCLQCPLLFSISGKDGVAKLIDLQNPRGEESMTSKHNFALTKFTSSILVQLTSSRIPALFTMMDTGPSRLATSS